jgi:hypothetical protein
MIFERIFVVFTFICASALAQLTATTTTANAGSTVVSPSSTSLLQTQPVDFPSRAVAAINNWLDGNIRTMGSLQVMDLHSNTVIVPPPKYWTLNTSATVINAVMNSTTQEALWSFWLTANLTTSTVSIGDTNGYVIQYTAYNPGGYSTPWTDGVSQFAVAVAYGAVIPNQDHSAVANGCKNSNFFYRTDQNTGKTAPGGTAYKTSTYCQTFRPFYAASQAAVNQNLFAFYGPLYSSTTGALIYTIAKTYYR